MSNEECTKEFEKHFKDILTQAQQKCSALIAGIRRLENDHNSTLFRATTVQKLINITWTITKLVISDIPTENDYHPQPPEYKDDSTLSGMMHYIVQSILENPPSEYFKNGLTWFCFLDSNWQQNEEKNPFFP